MLIDERHIVEQIRKANDAMSVKDYENAYIHAKNALQLDPTNQFAQKLYKKAAKCIRNERKTVFNAKLKELRSHKGNTSDEKLLTEYEKLNTYYPGSIVVLLAIAHLRRKLEIQKSKTNKQFIKACKETIKSLRKNGKLAEAIQYIDEVLPHLNYDSYFTDLKRKLQHEYVIHELRMKDKFIEREDYENLYKFLMKLYAIFPEDRILKLIDKTENMILEKRKFDKRLFISESLQLANSLYSMNKFEDCMQACEELTGITKNTLFEGQLLYKKAKQKNEVEMNKLLYDKIKKDIIEIKKEYKLHSEEFVRI